MSFCVASRCRCVSEMERSEEESSPCCHHHPASSDDVITGGPWVTCVGGSDLVESRSDDSLPGPIRHCSGDQGAGLNSRDDLSPNMELHPSLQDATEGSKVNLCGRLEGDSHGGGGATGGTAPCLAEPSSQVVSLAPDSDSDTQEEVISDDDAFITEPGELRLHATAALSRNTFVCGRRQSAPGQLVQDDGESDLQSRRPDIVEYFSSRRQRSVSHGVAGWKLFGKVPPKQSPSKQARIIQQEFEARQVVPRSSPTHHATGQQSKRKVEFEPLSTTALILEDRPPNLPAKSAEETQRHRLQYEEMVAGAKKRELKEAQRRQQQMKERVRQEEEISTATLVWNQNILPHWDNMRSSRRARDLWWGGLPPSVRGRVWSLVIGNELNITAELYEIFVSRAKEKWRSLSETETDDGPDSESSLELVSRDVSRTFPSLCVFQKGGPYHDVLQSILGAYTCYRPDVGYVQGMSSMAAMLVLNMDEVEAFISFSNLINRPCQLAFYRVHHQLDPVSVHEAPPPRCCMQSLGCLLPGRRGVPVQNRSGDPETLPGCPAAHGPHQHRSVPVPPP